MQNTTESSTAEKNKTKSKIINIAIYTFLIILVLIYILPLVFLLNVTVTSFLEADNVVGGLFTVPLYDVPHKALPGTISYVPG